MVILQSKEVYNHVRDLKKVRCKQYKFSINPLKCAFSVFGKFLGFTIHRKENDLDSVKAKASKL